MTAAGQKELANSTEQLHNTGVNLIVNRDGDGYAEGKLFIDEGKMISELTKKDYEHFEFKLVNKTLQKLTLNTDFISTGRQNLSSVVIADAEDLINTQNMKACLIERSGFVAHDLANPVWDNNTKTLTVMSQGGEGINIYQMHSIILRDENDPYSLCDVQSAGWYIDPKYDPAVLDNSTADINLISKKYPEMNMTMTLTVGGNLTKIVNIKIMPFVLTGGDLFEVPDDIVDVQGAVAECWGANCQLRKFIKLNMSPDGDFLLTVINGEEETPVDIW